MKFKTFAASVAGVKYLKKGWMCQDSSGKLDFDGGQIIAIADGHGSSNCFRSQIGSKIAVDLILQMAKSACESRSDTFSETGIKNFKYNFWNAWRESVKNHWEDNAPDDSEIRYKSVSEKYLARFNSNDKSIVERYLYTAYGTTLICAISIETQILILQIGDGTAVMLNKSGEFSIPVPPEPSDFLNVTTSLSEENAFQKIRHVVIDCSDNNPNIPVAIFLSSDGVDDCFEYHENEKHLYKFYSDTILENMTRVGYESTAAEVVDELLPFMTQKSSNDDISLAYFVTDNLGILRMTFSQISSEYKTQSETQPEDKIAENSDIARARIYKKYPAAMEIKLKLKLQIKKSRQIDQGENSDV